MKTITCFTPGCGEELAPKFDKNNKPFFFCEECGAQVQYRAARGVKMVRKALGAPEAPAAANSEEAGEGAAAAPAAAAPGPAPASDKRRPSVRLPFGKG